MANTCACNAFQFARPHADWCPCYKAASTSVLDEAKEIIYGDREQTYGEPGINLKRIARLWNAYLSNRDGDLSAEDVAWMMVLLKTARQQHASKRDNLVDACGYIALIERLD